MLTQVGFIQAKRREELSERITKKLQSETALNHDIQETDRELKTLRIATETAEAVWRQKEIAVCVFFFFFLIQILTAYTDTCPSCHPATHC